MLLAVAVGGVLALAGLVLLVPLPELGVPLVLAGLRLLGRRYGWARAANARVDAAVARARARWRRLPRAVRMLLLGALVVVVAVAVRLLF